MAALPPALPPLALGVSSYTAYEGFKEVDRKEVEKFRIGISLGFLDKIGEIILSQLVTIYRNSASPISFPYLTPSNACILIHEEIAPYHLKGLDFSQEWSEYSPFVIRDHDFGNTNLIEKVGAASIAQLRRAFFDADLLLYSFLKGPEQRINLAKIIDLKQRLCTTIKVVNVDPAIEGYLLRLINTANFLSETLGLYEEIARKNRQVIEFTANRMKFTPLPPPLLNLIVEYLDEDYEFTINCDIIAEISHYRLLQETPPKQTNSLFSCFECCF